MITINNITIGISKKKLIEELNNKKIPFERRIEYIAFETIINDHSYTVAVFTKGKMNYQIIITSLNLENPLNLNFVPNGNEYIYNDDKIKASYNFNNDRYYARIIFADFQITKTNKSIYICLILFGLFIGLLFYLFYYLNNDFSLLSLIIFLLSGLICGIIMSLIYYLNDLKNNKISNDYLNDDNIEPNYIDAIDGLTSYGNNIKLKPNLAKLFLYNDKLIIKIKFKNKDLIFSYLYDDVNLSYTKTYIKIVNKDRTILFFVDDNIVMDRLISFLNKLNLISKS